MKWLMVTDNWQTMMILLLLINQIIDFIIDTFGGK